jgi:hypothetical protein
MSYPHVSIAYSLYESQCHASQNAACAKTRRIKLRNQNFFCFSHVLYTKREKSIEASGVGKKLPEWRFCGTLMVGLCPRRWLLGNKMRNKDGFEGE